MKIKKLFNAYDNLSIKTKLTIVVIIAAAIPALFIGIMFASRLYSMVISDTIRNQQSESTAMAPQIADTLSQITDAGEIIASQDYYKELFASPVTEDYSSLALSDEAKDFQQTIETIVNSTPVSAVRIYFNLPAQDYGFFQSYNSLGVFLPEKQSKGTYWHGIFSASHPYTLFCPSLYLSPDEQMSYGDCAYIFRDSSISGSQSYTAYIVLYYSSEIFSDIMTKNITTADSISYIINERNAIVSTTNGKESGMYFQYYEDLQDYLMSSNSFVEKKILGETVYIAINYIKSANWFVVTVTPQRPLVTAANKVVMIFVGLALLAISLAIAIAMVQTKSITDRLSALTHQMSQVRSSYPKPLPNPCIHDEVGQLISTYNYMTQEMDTLVEKQKATAEELKMSEFNALQAQINPHFLYNMMDVINWMVISDKPAEASRALQQLARFYKLTLSRKKNISNIKRELEHAQAYIDLQNMRYSDAFELVIDMPDELNNCQIPKLTLQPIIENAIIHGIMEKEDKRGTIVITGWEEDQDICILVSDDGIGIEEDQLSDILSADRKNSSSGTNVAVYNIHNRLQLLYGPKYGLTYDSIYEKGCDVTIRIPKTME